jgi:uncharacterized membrane protein YdjX (TVP38/TMEM64 family)
MALLLLLALTWQFSPAKVWLDPEHLLEAARTLPWLLKFAVFVLAGCMAVPLSLLVLLSVLVLGPWLGGLTSLLGGAVIGALTFGLAQALGREAVAHWAGPRLQSVNALVARRGLLAVVLVRLVPAAPFAMVNLMLGVTPLRWGTFLLGNSLGMLPMVMATAILAPQILAQLKHPTPLGWLFVAAVLALVLAGTWTLKRCAAQQ